MIPADVASQLRTLLPEKTTLQGELNKAPQPAARLLDVLNNLVPGQRLLAEIQTILPNGAYRAMVGQRELTLALPFSAKSGDTLELEVVEQDGNISLAFVGKKNTGENAPTPQHSVSTQLSKAGNLIGELLIEVDQQGGKAKPALLNGNQPLLEAPPSNAKDIVPVLKQALHASGMFYEAHQAQWVKGQLPMSSLLNEPQGKLSTLQPTAGEGKLSPSSQHPAEARSTTITRTSPSFDTNATPSLKGALEQTYHSPLGTQTLTLANLATGEASDADTSVSLSMEASKALTEDSALSSGNSLLAAKSPPPPPGQERVATQALSTELAHTPSLSMDETVAPPGTVPQPANTPFIPEHQQLPLAENALISQPQEGETSLQSTQQPPPSPNQFTSTEESTASPRPEELPRPPDIESHSDNKKQQATNSEKSISQGSLASGQPQVSPRDASNTGNTSPATQAHEAIAARPTIAPELTPLVQQQLNALATQTYAWQGMIWPGQSMQWEITEDDGKPRSIPDDFPSRWQTRLRLDLPQLGAIDARLRLGNTGALELNLTTDNPKSEQLLRAASTELANALQTAGLTLNKFTANHGEPSPG